jgi:hypothetical protein
LCCVLCVRAGGFHESRMNACAAEAVCWSCANLLLAGGHGSGGGNGGAGTERQPNRDLITHSTWRIPKACVVGVIMVVERPGRGRGEPCLPVSSAMPAIY